MAIVLPPISRELISFDYIRQLIGGNARVILEIGAHHGEYTAQFLTYFPAATIYAFEPEPRAIGKFKTSISDPRVHLFEMAIGTTDGEAQFHASSGQPPGVNPENINKWRAEYPEGWDQSGSLRAPKTHKTVWPWVKFQSIVTVKVRRLDTWARENGIGAVDFIWADLQGAEGDLISGRHETLAKTRYLYTEYSNDEWYEGQPNLIQLMEMLPNFTVLKRYSMDVLLKNSSP